MNYKGAGACIFGSCSIVFAFARYLCILLDPLSRAAMASCWALYVSGDRLEEVRSLLQKRLDNRKGNGKRWHQRAPYTTFQTDKVNHVIFVHYDKEVSERRVEDYFTTLGVFALTDDNWELKSVIDTEPVRKKAKLVLPYRCAVDMSLYQDILAQVGYLILPNYVPPAVCAQVVDVVRSAVTTRLLSLVPKIMKLKYFL